jgi:hypothetical protein
MIGRIALPMIGDFTARAEPNVIKRPHVLEELNQACAPARPANQSIMQSDR